MRTYPKPKKVCHKKNKMQEVKMREKNEKKAIKTKLF